MRFSLSSQKWAEFPRLCISHLRLTGQPQALSAYQLLKINRSYWLPSSNYSSNHPNNPATLYSNLKVQNVDGLRRITMTDIKTRNALSMELMSNLVAAINEDKSSRELRCITIESVDGPVYSAGHNLKELTTDRGLDSQKAIFSKCTELMLAIRKSEVPVIAVVKGLAAAAGCQLVSACDFAIATDHASFSTPGANFGLFCSTPGVEVSRVVNRSTAAFMVLSGLPLTAHEALQAGLIAKVVPETKIDSLLDEIYTQIKQKSRPILKLGKEFFYHQLSLGHEEALRQGGGVMVDNLQLADCQEGLRSFKEKRKPKWSHTESKA